MADYVQPAQSTGSYVSGGGRIERTDEQLWEGNETLSQLEVERENAKRYYAPAVENEEFKRKVLEKLTNARITINRQYRRLSELVGPDAALQALISAAASYSGEFVAWQMCRYAERPRAKEWNEYVTEANTIFGTEGNVNVQASDEEKS